MLTFHQASAACCLFIPNPKGCYLQPAVCCFFFFFFYSFFQQAFAQDALESENLPPSCMRSKQSNLTLMLREVLSSFTGCQSTTSCYSPPPLACQHLKAGSQLMSPLHGTSQHKPSSIMGSLCFVLYCFSNENGNQTVNVFLLYLHLITIA